MSERKQLLSVTVKTRWTDEGESWSRVAHFKECLHEPCLEDLLVDALKAVMHEASVIDLLIVSLERVLTQSVDPDSYFVEPSQMKALKALLDSIVP